MLQKLLSNACEDRPESKEEPNQEFVAHYKKQNLNKKEHKLNIINRFYHLIICIMNRFPCLLRLCHRISDFFQVDMCLDTALIITFGASNIFKISFWGVKPNKVQGEPEEFTLK